MTKQYLVYVTGKDNGGKSRILPMSVEATGADIQRKKHIEDVTARALESGFAEVNDVFFADAVHAAVEDGMEEQGDSRAVVVDLHNELSFRGALQDPPDINEALWRIADSFLTFQEALPKRSKVQMIKSLGSNQPSWDRAVYGVFKLDSKGERVVEKRAVDDLAEIKRFEKAGMNVELLFRVLAKMGALEPVIRMIERKVRRLVSNREQLGLDDAGGDPVEAPDVLKISTKKTANEHRNPF
jgi:hypothetical protein